MITSGSDVEHDISRCTVHFKPRRLRSGYTVDVRVHRSSDDAGSSMPIIVMDMITEVEPETAAELRRRGAVANSAQRARWGGCGFVL